ncbi:hypothetical protein Tco_1040096 [Tanacetum coccineum]
MLIEFLDQFQQILGGGRVIHLVHLDDNNFQPLFITICFFFDFSFRSTFAKSNPEFPLQLLENQSPMSIQCDLGLAIEEDTQLLENQSPMSIQCDLGLAIEEDTFSRIHQDLGAMLSIKTRHTYFPTI